MARDDVRQKLTDYISARIAAETKGEGKRGEAAKIAKKTGFSSAHIANVSNGNIRGVGDDFARAMAKFWGMTYAQLEAVATGHATDPVVESDDEEKLDAKHRVRRTPIYEGAPDVVRYWFDHDPETDKRTATKDAEGLKFELYMRRLITLKDQHAVAPLDPIPTEPMGGAKFDDEPDDPDAPKRG